ncbi:MAG: hypothetical protein AAB035_02510 [Nitrospirota bacterium]
MQRVAFVLFLILIPIAMAHGNDDPLQTANIVYRLSEEMILHGSEGHAHEIITFGEKMIEELDHLPNLLHQRKIGNQKKVLKQIKEIRKRAEEAVFFSKKRSLQPALKSARLASFHAKKLRDDLRSSGKKN